MNLSAYLYLIDQYKKPIQNDMSWIVAKGYKFSSKPIMGLFGSVIAVAFQIAFCAKMHANDFFYFLKIIFDISTSKWFENTKNILIWS